MSPASFIPASNTVCVMDASGQLGSNLVHRLLRSGYIVHAAVQPQDGVDHDDEAMTERLMVIVSGGGGEEEEVEDIDGEEKRLQYKMRLKIFECDLFDYHSILDALRGCSGLFYCFEPDVVDDQSATTTNAGTAAVYDEQTVDVEVRAAHNVLEACAQIDTIDKVVFTSSATAVIWREDRKSIESDLDERHWSDIEFCRKFKLWHALSKTLAEKSAWALSMDRGINMVSINPGLILSPDLTITHPYLRGAAEMYTDGVLVTVNMEFLVDAHLTAFEDISTYGRYLCFNHVINRTEDAMELAKLIAPSLPHDNNDNNKGSLQGGGDDEEKMIQQRISNKKLNKLLVEFHSNDQSNLDL